MTQQEQFEADYLAAFPAVLIDLRKNQAGQYLNPEQIEAYAVWLQQAERLEAEIAAKLAWRDAEINRLRIELSELRTKAEAQQAASLTTPTLNASCVPEAPRPNDKHTFVFPDASMTKIRYIFVDGEMVYENLESEQ